MKKIIISAIIALLMPMSLLGQTASSLWKKYDTAMDKDHPKDAMAILQSIADKSIAEKEWGHLIKAEYSMMSLQYSITPDSLQSMVEELERKAVMAEKVEPALAAVYNMCLGRFYSDGFLPMNDTKTNKELADKHFAKALSNPKILAETKARHYEPLLVQGDGSLTFGNDLLHVVAFEAKEYNLARQWYEDHGNRPAACLSAFYQVQKERFEDTREIRKSKYMATLDSLIHVYRDLPEAGEIAIEHFNFMDQALDASSQEKVEYIDYALRTWPTWSRMAVLRNARSRITLPSFHVLLPETTVIPGKEIPVVFPSIINLSDIHVTVTKLRMTGADEFDPSSEKDMKMIRSMMEDSPVFDSGNVYYGLPDYKSVSDTILINPLPLGVYLVEVTTTKTQVAPERCLLHVTNLRLMDMDMPGEQARLIVVDATTGKPVSGAKINLQFREWKSGRMHESEETLTTESNGEITFKSTFRPYRYRVTTNDDKAMEWHGITTSWTKPFEDAEKTVTTTQIYTDRAIYRPGQEVNVAVVAFKNAIYGSENSPLAGEELNLVVRDNDGFELSSKLVTDEWGVANMTFQLPDGESRNGYVTISEKKNGGTKRIRVEQYKRPTFVVSIDEYNESYKAGDTITVIGRANTYAGGPVQGAKVKYRAKSSMARWWSFFYRGSAVMSETLIEDEATTNADGTFAMRIPIEIPAFQGPRSRCFYSIDINADVTSLSGETRSGNRALPLSDTPTALVIDGLPEKVCLEQLPEVTLRMLNNAGQPVESVVKYSIDGGERVEAKSNETVTLDFCSMKKGEHVLNLYCEQDSVKQKFVVFSLDDKAPVIETDDWYADNLGTYNEPLNFKEGEPVRMQIGTSRDDQTIFYAMVSAKDVIEEGSFVLSNANMNRDIYYKKEWGDGIAVRYSWVRDGKMYTHLERLHKPEKDTQLKLEWSTFRDKLVPGQKEQWTLSVKNPDGSPAKAHMIATIYDKSLEALVAHDYKMVVPHYTYTPTISSSQRNINTARSLYGEQTFRPLAEPRLEFYHLDLPEISPFGFGVYDEVMMVGFGSPKMAKSAAKPMMMKSRATLNAASSMEMADAEAPVDTYAAQPEEQESDLGDVAVRENLNETAVFLPELVADKNGNVAIRFTLPESLTTWRFLGVAHDKEMKNGVLTGEAIAQKQLMVQPNVPRFVREGDKGQISATITNTTANVLNGTAQITVLNAESQKQVYQQRVAFNVKGNETTAATFSLPQDLPADMYVVKFVAKAGTFSDGEQQYMPVLSEKEVVTTTRAITQVKPGKKVVDLNELFGKNTQNEKVTVEYTNNPAWLMVDALPAAIKECKDEQNAVSLSTALYAATLSKYIKTNVEDVALDADTLEATSAKLRTALTTLQNVDGSFSWWPSMPGSTYMTLTVVRNLVRLDALLGVQSENSALVAKAMNYLTTCINREVADLKKFEKDNKHKPMPSEVAMDYLYLQSINQVADVKLNKSDIEYLMSLLKNRSKELTIYGKANIAVAFAKSKIGGDRSKAQELLKSMEQYSVATELMGRYFDTPKAQYSWRDYKIPTETAAIEALQAVRPEEKVMVAEMRQWLLNEKRTQQWDTPINTTSAIYAFLNGNITALDEVTEPAKITLDNKTFTTDGKKKGFFKTTEEGRYNKVTFDKASEGMSFGAVYTEALQPVMDVENVTENQLKITREIVDADGKPVSEFTVGQKVVVRLTITAERDYDFLEVVDNRPACFEPANQLSGYRWGYYVSPRDNKTSFYLCQMPKGKRVIETEYFVDRAGTYQSGLVVARCAYAPEFSAREKAYIITVK